MKMSTLITLCALPMALSAVSAHAADGKALYVEKTCTACHGKDGKTPLMPDYPKIAGQNAKYIEKQMLDIKTGARANGNSAAMKGVMVIVSDEEIKTIAEFVAKMKP